MIVKFIVRIQQSNGSVCYNKIGIGVLIWEGSYTKVWSLWRGYRRVSIKRGYSVTIWLLFRWLWHVESFVYPTTVSECVRTARHDRVV